MPKLQAELEQNLDTDQGGQASADWLQHPRVPSGWDFVREIRGVTQVSSSANIGRLVRWAVKLGSQALLASRTVVPAGLLESGVYFALCDMG